MLPAASSCGIVAKRDVAVFGSFGTIGDHDENQRRCDDQITKRQLRNGQRHDTHGNDPRNKGTARAGQQDGDRCEHQVRQREDADSDSPVTSTSDTRRSAKQSDQQQARRRWHLKPVAVYLTLALGRQPRRRS